MEDVATKKPDLWYPFWMTFTLIFAFFFGGFMNNFIAGNAGASDSYVSIGVYTGILIADLLACPLIVWLVAWCLDLEKIKFDAIFALLGYSYTILLPFAIAGIPISLIPGQVSLIINAVLFSLTSCWSVVFVIYQSFRYLKNQGVKGIAYLAFSLSLVLIHALALVLLGLTFFNIIKA